MFIALNTPLSSTIKFTTTATVPALTRADILPAYLQGGRSKRHRRRCGASCTDLLWRAAHRCTRHIDRSHRALHGEDSVEIVGVGSGRAGMKRVDDSASLPGRPHIIRRCARERQRGETRTPGTVLTQRSALGVRWVHVRSQLLVEVLLQTLP